MQTKYMISGSTVNIIKLNEDTALDVLPPRVYTVEFNTLAGFYLTVTKDELTLPEKIYGRTHERVEKCICTYKDRDTSTGVLLTGDKGTGKTLLMSLLANRVIDELNLPVILIKESFHGGQFNSFIEDIGECALVFDEFGKMYSNQSHQEDSVSQDSLLSLMDGVDKTKRLIILTENKEFDISTFMLNRPSRVYYHFRYSKLDEDSIIGYCKDHEVDSKIVNDIIDISRRSSIFSFDMLQSIVEEHLRFDCSIDEVVQDLNIDISQEFGSNIEILSVVRTTTKEQRVLYGSPVVVKPDRELNYTHIKLIPERGNRPSDSNEVAMASNDGYKYDDIYIKSKNLVYQADGQLVYQTDEYTITATIVPPTYTNYFNLF